MPFFKSQFRFVSGYCCLLFAFIGCHKPQTLKDRASVSGTVAFDGKPLRSGTIAFEAMKGPVTTTAMISDGKYSTRRASIGENFVTVETESVRSGNPAAYVPIPERYNGTTTSKLSATIHDGDNENVDFTLTK